MGTSQHSICFAMDEELDCWHGRYKNAETAVNWSDPADSGVIFTQG